MLLKSGSSKEPNGWVKVSNFPNILDIWGCHKKGTSLLIDLIVVALEHGLQWQRWWDSLILEITIHLDSQADSDDSIQLNPSFSGSSKETQFPIPNYISIEVNDSSMILSELWQNEADSTHEIHTHYFHSIHSWDLFAKCCRYISFVHLPDLLPTYLANQLQSRQLIDVAGTSLYTCIKINL